MKSVKYSVLMSIYSKENPIYLKLSIESMINQTLAPEEIVLVKDGPLTDKLEEIIEYYNLNYPGLFTIVSLERNFGLGKALNEGLKRSRNELIARMDTDDISLERRIEIQINYLTNNPEIDILGCFAIDIDETGSTIKTRRLPIGHENIKKLIWTNPIIHPSVIFKKTKISEIGSYNEGIKRRQDYELWFRAIASGLKFENISEPLVYYRITEDYFKKNNFRKQISQFRIGFRGCVLVRARPIAYLGLLFPIVRGLIPKSLRKSILKSFDTVDPRNKPTKN